MVLKLPGKGHPDHEFIHNERTRQILPQDEEEIKKSLSVVQCQITAARYKYHSGLVFLLPLTHLLLFILLSFPGYLFTEAKETNGLLSLRFDWANISFPHPWKGHRQTSLLQHTSLWHTACELQCTASSPQESNMSATCLT